MPGSTATSKIFETGAYKREIGVAVPGPIFPGWGIEAGWQTPGAGDAFPWLTFGNELTINTVTDDAVTTNAFEGSPRLVGRRVDLPLSFNARYSELDYFLFWMMGFENNILDVIVFVNDTTDDPWTPSGPPAVGTLFEDGVPTNSDYKYVRTETGKDTFGEAENYYVFENSVVPDNAPAGTMTEVGGGGKTLDFTAVSGVLKEHLYEIDADRVICRDYSTAEAAELDDYTAGDAKVISMTLAKRMKLYDFRYGNSVCRSFTLNIPTEDIAMWETNFLAFKQERSDTPGGFGSEDWSNDPILDDIENVPAHYSTVFQVGVDVANLVEICTTDISVSCDIPWQQIQTTCSGHFLAEPFLEGKYKIGINGQIAFSDIALYQDYRDAQTKLVARISSHEGFEKHEITIGRLSLQKSGPGDETVAQEALEGTAAASPSVTDDWIVSDWYGSTITPLQEGSPMRIVLRNSSDVNSMFLP